MQTLIDDAFIRGVHASDNLPTDGDFEAESTTVQGFGLEGISARPAS